MTYPIPKDALDDRLAIVGTAGSGKTYLTLGAIEHLLARKSRIIGIDPLGVMWGLRLCEDGKTPSPFQPVIFGGAHGDLPINEHAGALVGQTVATMRESCIIDLSMLGTKAAERRFMLAFLTALYRETDKEPVHLIVDEADMFAPQKLLDKEGDAAKLLGMMETVVRRGRVRGFIPWLITQRPAVLSKDVLSQADGLVALKLTSSQDRDAIGSWIEGQGDKAAGKAMLATLPGKQRGEGVLWIPGRDILRNVAFPPKATFDSSRTPKRGEKRVARELKPINLDALKTKLASVETEAKANDPKALKAEVGRLKSEIQKLSVAKTDNNQPDPKASESARASAATIKRLRTALEAAMKLILEIKTSNFFNAAGPPLDKDAVSKVIADAVGEAGKLIEAQVARRSKEAEALKRNAETMVERLGKLLDEDITVQVNVQHNDPFTVSKAEPSVRIQKPASVPLARQTNGSSGAHLPPGERAVLIAAAQFGGVEREQLTILTGYKRSSRDAYIQRLREKGMIVVTGNRIDMTEVGNAALPTDYEPLPTGNDLQEYWLRKLPEGEAKVLQVLIGAYPNGVDRDHIDAETGYKRSSRDAYLQRMKAKRLWEPHNGGVRASEVLFG